MATNDFISVDRTVTTATHASLLLQYVSSLRQAFELGTRVKAIMDHTTDGGDFKKLETLFGIPEGQGQAIYELMNIVIETSLKGTQQLTERVG